MDEEHTIDDVTTLGHHLSAQLEAGLRMNLFSDIHHGGVVPVPVAADPKPEKIHKRKNWGPVPATRQSKRNMGKADIMEKAKLYKMKMNLEIPKTFKNQNMDTNAPVSTRNLQLKHPVVNNSNC
jgi:hypothetical protein